MFTRGVPYICRRGNHPFYKTLEYRDLNVSCVGADKQKWKQTSDWYKCDPLEQKKIRSKKIRRVHLRGVLKKNDLVILFFI